MDGEYGVMVHELANFVHEFPLAMAAKQVWMAGFHLNAGLQRYLLTT